MNTNKFDKNRSVWSHWYTTPTVYMLDVTGSNTQKKQIENKNKEVDVKGEFDKTLAIIQFYGNKALVGWRNNDTAKMGMTKMCPIIIKDKKTYLVYRGRKIEISHKKRGWVI